LSRIHVRSNSNSQHHRIHFYIQPPLFHIFNYTNKRDLHSFPTRRSSDLVYQIWAATQYSLYVGDLPFHNQPPNSLVGHREVTSRDRKSTRLNSVTWPSRMPSSA